MKFLLVVLALFVSTQAQAQAQAFWDTEGYKLSPLAGVVMADTGLVTGTQIRGVILKCSGFPLVVGGVAQGGNGLYSFQRYTVDAVDKEVPLAHIILGHDDLQSIPPISLLVGQGLRIVTAWPLVGRFGCSIWSYIAN